MKAKRRVRRLRVSTNGPCRREHKQQVKAMEQQCPRLTDKTHRQILRKQVSTGLVAMGRDHSPLIISQLRRRGSYWYVRQSARTSMSINGGGYGGKELTAVVGRQQYYIIRLATAICGWRTIKRIWNLREKKKVPGCLLTVGAWIPGRSLGHGHGGIIPGKRQQTMQQDPPPPIASGISPLSPIFK